MTFFRCDGDNDCTDGKDPEDVSSDEIGCEAMVRGT